MKLEEVLNFTPLDNPLGADLPSIMGIPPAKTVVDGLYEATLVNKLLVESYVGSLEIEPGKHYMVLPSSLFRSVAQMVDDAFPDLALQAKAILYHSLMTELIEYGGSLFDEKSKKAYLNTVSSANPLSPVEQAIAIKEASQNNSNSN